MGLVCPELSLDLKASFVPETINGFLREIWMIGDASERLDKVDEFTRRLEDEMNKIQVFKRELPLCMLLLKDAILYLKQESTQYKTRNAHQPVLEEFIPLKKDSTTQINNSNNSGSVGGEQDQKKNWMSSVQLWNQTQNDAVKEGDDKRNASKGFVPMLHTSLPVPELTRKADKEEEDVSVPGLSLLLPAPPGIIKYSEEDSIISRSSFNPKSHAHAGRLSHHHTTSARKQRRCWSPELHRRFVDALTHLGGPQVATPKQIRELMRVDGLTNDEVKSHLQKYRLHTRRVPNDSGTSGNKNGQGLSGSWTAQDQYSESSKPSSSQSQSASPEGPLQFPGLTVTGGTSTTGGDSMEEEDDEKSESYSWKGHVRGPENDDV